MTNRVPVHRQSGRYTTMVSWRKAIWGTPFSVSITSDKGKWHVETTEQVFASLKAARDYLNATFEYAPPLGRREWRTEINRRLNDRGFVELDECDALSWYDRTRTLEEVMLEYIDQEIEDGWEPMHYDRESDDGSDGNYGPEESLVARVAPNGPGR
jgi:hypothetical protein